MTKDYEKYSPFGGCEETVYRTKKRSASMVCYAKKDLPISFAVVAGEDEEFSK